MLGRGLNSLIPIKKIAVPRSEATASTTGVEEIKEGGEKIINLPLEQIEPNPYQPRKEFAHQAQEELINSIREHGIIEPLILTPGYAGSASVAETTSAKEAALRQGESGLNRKFQIIAGERRFRAAKFLGLKTVPVIIRKASEIEKLELSLLENLQRKDLNPLEKARAYQRLIDEFNLTEEEVAKKVGKARPTISNTRRLLSLPLLVQKAIEEEKISEGHAKTLLSLEDKDKQEMFLKRILGLGLTVREAEKLTQGKRVYKKIELEPEILKKEEELTNLLGAKVSIHKMRKKRKIVIEVYNDEELNRLLEKLLS